jgi:hypothetical protein
MVEGSLCAGPWAWPGGVDWWDAVTDPLGVGNTQQVAYVGAVRDLRRDLPQPRYDAFCARSVSGNEDNSGALGSERLSGDPPNPSGGSSDDDDLSVHTVRPAWCMACIASSALYSRCHCY